MEHDVTKTALGVTALLVVALLGGLESAAGEGDDLPYPIVDTGQVRCYDARRETRYPKAGQAFFGQDAHYAGNTPTYVADDDGTVVDLVTGLMWTQDPGAKMTWRQAVAGASSSGD